MIISRSAFVFFLTLFCMVFLTDTDGRAIDLGPLYHPVKNSRYEKEFTALGPFVTYKKGQEGSELGFRPFYYRTVMERDKTRELEFLYPMASYKKAGDRSWFQYQLFLLSYESLTDSSGYKSKELTLFPFIFYNSEKDPKDNHFAVFPFYGSIKGKLARDEIKFLFFPLYVKTESEDEITKSLFWPFLSRYEGKHRGGRFFPVFGKRTNESKGMYEKFLFWPVYVKKEKEFYGETAYFRSIFPLYSESYSYGILNRGYFWPFVQQTTNQKKGDKRWDLPWPIFNFTRGKTTNQIRIFPFYSRTRKNENDEDGYIMFPIYNYKNLTLESYRRERKSVFFFLYKDLKEKPIVEGTQPRRRIDMWPLFSYNKDSLGNRNLHALTVFEPFIRSNDRLYRNYAPMWRVFTWERSADNITRSSLLWNTVSVYRDEKDFVFNISPFMPLFKYFSGKSGMSWNIMGGLIGYSSKGGGSTLKILYMPIKI